MRRASAAIALAGWLAAGAPGAGWLASGAPGAGWFGSAPAAAQTAVQLQQRIDAQEAELRRLTGELERLSFELRRLREAQEAQLQDLEFRVIELEGGDPTEAFREPAPEAPPLSAPETPAQSPAQTPAPAAQAQTPPRPPAAAPGRPATPPADATGPGAPPAPLGALRGTISPEERAAFDAAMRDLDALGPDAGRRSVGDYLAEHPGGALGAEALARVGTAYAAAGRHQEAARVFLEGVRDHAGKPGSADALLGLGQSLAALGATDQACAAFRELAARADAPPSLKARGAEAARRAGCG